MVCKAAAVVFGNIGFISDFVSFCSGSGNAFDAHTLCGAENGR